MKCASVGGTVSVNPRIEKMSSKLKLYSMQAALHCKIFLSKTEAAKMVRENSAASKFCELHKRLDLQKVFLLLVVFWYNEEKDYLLFLPGAGNERIIKKLTD